MANEKNQVPAQVSESKKVESPEKKKAREEKKAKRNEAKKRVLAFIDANKDQLGDLANDIRMFVGAVRRESSGATRSSINSALRTALLEAGPKGLTEMDIFKMFRIGRPEMVTKIRILVLTPNPADRVWVKFNESDETYRVVGTGAQPPKGWDGYVPSEKNSL